jgi:hypothetical protein
MKKGFTLILLLLVAILLFIVGSLKAQTPEVWVDDDFNSGTPGWGVTHFDKVQDGVNAVDVSGTVYIATGTYTEQVYINKEGLIIDGEGEAVTLIKSPAVLTLYFISSGTTKNYPVVFLEGIAGATIQDLTVDGDKKGAANYRFVGIGFWNAGGTVLNAHVTNIMNDPFSGAQHGVGIYAYNNTSGPYSITLNNVLIDEYQKNAIALLGAGLTVDLDDVTTQGYGPTSITAQNGIQVGNGATGTIDDCSINDVDYTGSGWTASGLLVSYTTSVVATHVDVDGCQTSVYYQDAGGSYDEGTVTNTLGDGVIVYNTTLGDGGSKVKKTAAFDTELGYTPKGDPVTMNFDGSSITGIDDPNMCGIMIWADEAITSAINDCDITHWGYGIYAYEDAPGLVNVTVHETNLANNVYGFVTNATAKALQDATWNWWGDATGPYHPTLNPTGTGSEVSDGILFDPWHINPDMNGDIDIGLFVTTCADFEVRLRPVTDLTNTNLTNVQFTIKWPVGTVNIINVASTYGIAQQGPVIQDGGYNYAVFVGLPDLPLDWTAGTEYVVMTFSHDESGTGTCSFEIADDTWAQNNNGVYYAELLGFDATGIIYHNEPNVYIGPCGVQVKAYLHGPYNTALHEMNIDLNTALDIPLAQPYNVAPWNYAGTESVATIPADVVDWVLVELRTDASTLFERKAAFLLKDGSIVQYDDVGLGISFDGLVAGDSYFIVVWQRNHMPVMSGDAVVLPTTAYDFTDYTTTQPYGYPALVQIELETGVWGMIAGDVNANGQLKYSGPNNDRGYIIALIYTVTGSPLLTNVITGEYWMEDVNMNDEVRYVGTANDRDIIVQNLNYLTGVPYLHYVYTSVVPGAYTAKEGSAGNGMLDISLFEDASSVTVSLTSNGWIESGLIDNLQFTLGWQKGDTYIEEILQGFVSGFGLVADGPVMEAGGYIYQAFVSVAPIQLPVEMNSGDEVAVMVIPKAGQQVGDRLQIMDDGVTAAANASYYVGVWGADYTGAITGSLTASGEIPVDPLVKIYPNPVSRGVVTIDSKDLEGSLEVRITDLTGRLLLSTGIKGNDRQQIRLDGLSKGVYLISVQGKNVMLNDRLVVN